MDKQQRKELKALGKAEVERQSAELRAASAESNPRKPGDADWGDRYKQGRTLDIWLRRKAPVIHKAELEAKFVVWDRRDDWTAHYGGYLLCNLCGSAVPSKVPRRPFFWRSCACGNMKYRMLLWWRWASVRDIKAVCSVKLMGRGT